MCGKETTERKYCLKDRFEKPTELGRIMENLVGEQSTDGIIWYIKGGSVRLTARGPQWSTHLVVWRNTQEKQL